MEFSFNMTPTNHCTIDDKQYFLRVREELIAKHGLDHVEFRVAKTREMIDAFRTPQAMQKQQEVRDRLRKTGNDVFEASRLIGGGVSERSALTRTSYAHAV